MNEDDSHSDLQIVVVGPCAAGKSTLVGNLRPKGYKIKACAQEHSFIPQLWAKLSKADILIFLDAALPIIAQRQKRNDWTQAALDEQHRRLAYARACCDLYFGTDDLTREQVAERVERFLQARGVKPRLNA